MKLQIFTYRILMVMSGAVLGVSLVDYTNAEADRCSDLLRWGIHDENTASDNSMEARRLYHFVCNEQSVTSEFITASSTTVIFDMFGLGAKRGATDIAAYRSKFCGKSEQEMFMASYVENNERKVNRYVVNAWRDCMLSAKGGVSLNPKVMVTETEVGFSIAYEDQVYSKSAYLRGVSSKIFNCEIGDAKISKSGIDEKPIELTATSTNIKCLRIPEKGEIDGRPFIKYRAGSLTLDLTTEAFHMEFIARREGPVVEEFEDLQSRVKELEIGSNGANERLRLLTNRQWYNVVKRRKKNQVYENNTDYPIEIAVSTTARGHYNFCHVEIHVDGKMITRNLDNNPDYAKICSAYATIPPRAKYKVVVDGYKGGRIEKWWELKAATD